LGWVFILIHRSISPCTFSPIAAAAAAAAAVCRCERASSLLSDDKKTKKENSFLVVWLPISKIARMLLLWDNRKTFPTYLSNTKNTRARAVLDSYIVHISVSSYIYCLYTYSTYTYRLDRRVKSSIVFFFFFFWRWSIYLCRWMDMSNACMCCLLCRLLYICSIFRFYFLFERLPEGMYYSFSPCVCV
jgi:hypothetical protein